MSLQGTTQAYQPLANTYLALAPSCGDKVFGTNVNYCDLVQWGIYDGQENDTRVLSMYIQQRDQYQNSVFAADKKAADTTDAVSYSTAPSNQRTTVWSLLSSLPQLSTFKKILERSGWKDYINQANELYKVTLFAPSNSAFKDTAIEHTPLENMNRNNLRLIGQAHTLPFAFEQSAAYGRKLRLYTTLDAFSVFLDGTGEITPSLSFYSQQPEPQLLNQRYPMPYKRINIVQGYYTNNGALYEIDGVFEPQVVLN